MTNDKAIEWLEAIRKKYIHGGDEGFDMKRNEALDLAISALSREEYVVLGEEEYADKLISFGRNADGLFGFTIYHLSEGREYGFIQYDDCEVDGDYFTILFGEKNGANVLRNFIRALREMLSAMERAEGEPRPEEEL